MLSFRFIYFLVILFHSTCSNMMMMPPDQDIFEDDPCHTCTKLSEKFVEAYNKTAGSNFGGGNTDWEERKLKEYAKSETRLIEILEKTCLKTESKCTAFLEEHEDAIEKWYHTSTPKLLEYFYEWLCIDTAKVCCPEGTFGKNCRRCQYGDNGDVCSGNGECDGDGTRTGTGRCDCDEEYKGTNCSICRNGYKKTVDDKKQVTCTDIDECKANIFIPTCHLLQCKNIEGSFECYGEPFYRQLPKMSALAVLLFTASYLMFKEMFGLASLTLITTSVFLVLFAKNLV